MSPADVLLHLESERRDNEGKKKRLVTHGLERYEFENTCNNDKNLSEIQLEHEKEDELVKVMVKVMHELGCMIVVKEIENELLEELDKLEWWFEQDIDDEGEEDEKGEGGGEGLELVRYGISNALDMAYWGFLGVRTMFDIFQNIHILSPIQRIGLLSIRRIDLISFVVFGECRHIYAISSLMDTAYWLLE
ncbi:hypothetical protein Tco_0647105 [Tanacetum coccineum]